MQTKIIEVVTPQGNHGKFLIGAFDTEYQRQDVQGSGLLRPRWAPPGNQGHFLVLDLETGEGALFRHGGLASADLAKRRVWVCVLFEDFLGWFYKQDVSDLDKLPDRIELEHPLEMRGYRRAGISLDELADTLIDVHDRLSTMGPEQLRVLVAGMVIAHNTAPKEQPTT